MRTAGSIAAAASRLGGQMVFFGKDALFDEYNEPREPPADMVLSLERQGYPIIFARLHLHSQLLAMVRAAKRASIVNALTAESHPLQELADVEALMIERPGAECRKIVFVGAGNNVATSLAEASVLLGWDFVHAGPPELQIKPGRWESILRLADTNGGSARFEKDLRAAVPGASMVYTDVFASMGEKNEKEKLEHLLRPYRVTADLMDLAGPDAVFGHCLPAERGVEADAEVIDGPRSIVGTIAGCRTDTTAALMQLLLESKWRAV